MELKEGAMETRGISVNYIIAFVAGRGMD